MASSRSEHVRFRYGICLNDQCSKSKSKEVQEVSARKDLICAECGKPLRECPRPRTWWEQNGKKVVGASVAVAVIGIGGLLASGVLGGSDQSVPDPTPVTAPVEQEKDTAQYVNIDTDTMEMGGQQPGNAPTGQPEKPHKPLNSGVTDGMGTINYDYGKYVGDIRNGKPDGAGVLTYTKAHKVVSTKDVMAQPGERFEGVFEDGKATFGTLYKKDGNTIKVKR